MIKIKSTEELKKHIKYGDLCLLLQNDVKFKICYIFLGELEPGFRGKASVDITKTFVLWKQSEKRNIKIENEFWPRINFSYEFGDEMIIFREGS